MKTFICYLGLMAPMLANCTHGPVGGNTDYLSGATLWYQTSGEVKALQYQAFSLAQHLLEEKLPTLKKVPPPAVILDIDDTVLDNGPFQGRVVLSGEPYPAGWDDWVKKSQAKAIPGAKEFLDFANKKRVRLFYVTNRKDIRKSDTIQNLKAVGFPDVSEETVICRTAESSKESRRQSISARHQVVLLIGDNLNDFAKDYEEKNLVDRSAAVDKTRDKFGTEFVMLPNPMYGDWEMSVYGFKTNLSDEEKAKIRKENIKGF